MKHSKDLIFNATSMLVKRRPTEKLDGFFAFIEKNFSIDGGCIFVWTPGNDGVHPLVAGGYLTRDNNGGCIRQ
jgi:adenine specific DNA methylase Mod